MDIVIISEHASPIEALGGKDAGGQNVYVAQLAKELVKLGHRVEVFTRKESSDAPMIQDLSAGFRLINVPAGPSEPIPKEKILPYMDVFTSFMLSYLKERKSQFDIIHANFFMSALVAADLKKLTGIPFITTFHALGKVRKAFQGDQDTFPEERFMIEERIVRESDGIIAECPQDLEDLLFYYNASLDKIEVVPCGFDSHEMHPIPKAQAKQRLGFDKDEEIILHLGRMVPRKGADNVIRGFSKFIKSHERKCRLVIVGGECNEADPLKTPEILTFSLITLPDSFRNEVMRK